MKHKNSPQSWLIIKWLISLLWSWRMVKKKKKRKLNHLIFRYCDTKKKNAFCQIQYALNKLLKVHCPWYRKYSTVAHRYIAHAVITQKRAIYPKSLYMHITVPLIKLSEFGTPFYYFKVTQEESNIFERAV